MVKELIEAIPTTKPAVFDYQVAWDFVDNEMIEQRVKPWLEKKIREYIGDDEPSLIEFICERINSRSEPSRLLGDLAMVSFEFLTLITSNFRYSTRRPKTSL
jgi:RNA-binding protein 25